MRHLDYYYKSTKDATFGLQVDYHNQMCCSMLQYIAVCCITRIILTHPFTAVETPLFGTKVQKCVPHYLNSMAMPARTFRGRSTKVLPGTRSPFWNTKCVIGVIFGCRRCRHALSLCAQTHSHSHAHSNSYIHFLTQSLIQIIEYTSGVRCENRRAAYLRKYIYTYICIYI